MARFTSTAAPRHVSNTRQRGGPYLNGCSTQQSPSALQEHACFSRGQDRRSTASFPCPRQPGLPYFTRYTRFILQTSLPHIVNTLNCFNHYLVVHTYYLNSPGFLSSIGVSWFNCTGLACHSHGYRPFPRARGRPLARTRLSPGSPGPCTAASGPTRPSYCFHGYRPSTRARGLPPRIQGPPPLLLYSIVKG